MAGEFDPSEFVCEICEQAFSDCHCDDYFNDDGQEPGNNVIYQEYPASYFTAPKEQSEHVDPSLCKFFLSGNCKFGDSCRYVHDRSSKGAPKREMCKFFMQGTCKAGSSCPFLHDVPLDQMNRDQLSKELMMVEHAMNELALQMREKDERRKAILQALSRV